MVFRTRSINNAAPASAAAVSPTLQAEVDTNASDIDTLQTNSPAFETIASSTNAADTDKLVFALNCSAWSGSEVKMTVMQVGSKKLCCLHGLVQRQYSTANSNRDLLTLPVGYRPSKFAQFVVVGTGSSQGLLGLEVLSKNDGGIVRIHSQSTTGQDGNSYTGFAVASTVNFALDPVQFWVDDD